MRALLQKLFPSLRSDGYHTFEELYEHRHYLLLLAMSLMDADDRGRGELRRCWKSRLHHDGSSYPGWFIAGIVDPRIGQISYHLPERLWRAIPGKPVTIAPAWDGHTPTDVLYRLQNLGRYIQEATAEGNGPKGMAGEKASV